ncbi:CASP-like protein 5C3 [Tanacetum coccineum]|uniref:CASP-like protein n=1 Tax=Tanacetum coccineum TaxID=301880 RepID=A0ABQ5FYB4_9ASTR
MIPWSLTLALVDAFSVFVKRPYRQVQLVLVIVIGDWILSFLSLAAACSTASVLDFMATEAGSSFCDGEMCSRYQLSAAMACLSWCLTLASALFNLWLLPSLYSVTR